jgi:hypothetical protein
MRYLLAVVVPPAAVIGLGRRSLAFAPIAVFWIGALVVLGLLPHGWWRGLAAVLWLAAAVWALLTVRGAEADEAHTPDSTAERHVDPERHYPAEDQTPPE